MPVVGQRPVEAPSVEEQQSVAEAGAQVEGGRCHKGQVPVGEGALAGKSGLAEELRIAEVQTRFEDGAQLVERK